MDLSPLLSGVAGLANPWLATTLSNSHAGDFCCTGHLGTSRYFWELIQSQWCARHFSGGNSARNCSDGVLSNLLHGDRPLENAEKPLSWDCLGILIQRHQSGLDCWGIAGRTGYKYESESLTSHACAGLTIKCWGSSYTYVTAIPLWESSWRDSKRQSHVPEAEEKINK